ncbi:ABC transporter substrate-binding protein [Metallumcola ferriviriculae]|uniref:ABC transporter substrate-binding protein n=1 Tax=Metallumcola ferriviriculae TaxID=3039180 RepID=A0AAU0USW1_9FIRM|nr:ABC transporter substrate-binding protein [Desulfitibacteraceae bacterium MK1]
MNIKRTCSEKVIVIIGVLILLLVAVTGCNSGSQQQEDVVYITQTGPANMLSQLGAKEIDGFVAWEPFNAEAVLGQDGKYLAMSGEIWPNHPCCILAANIDYQDDKVLSAVTWAHVKATRFINNPENKERVIEYAMEFTAKNREVVVEALKTIHFVEYPNVDEFEAYYSQLKAGGLLTKDFADIGYSEKEEFFSNFFVDSYYQEVSKQLKKDSQWVPQKVNSQVQLHLGFLTKDLHEFAVYVAQKEGFYQDVGLIPGANLEFVNFTNGVAAMEGFKNNDVDISYLGGAPATLKRINDDIGIKVIAGANEEGSAIVVRPDAGIDDFSDLKGKTIAIPAIGTVQYYLLEKALNDSNLKTQVK